MVGFDLALSHWVIGPAARICHLLAFEPNGKFVGYLGRTVVTGQSRPVDHRSPVEFGERQGVFERRRHIAGRHAATQTLGQDEPRVIVKHRGQVEPAPANDFQVRKVGWPQLIHPDGRRLEPIRRL